MNVILDDSRNWQVEWCGPFTTRVTRFNPNVSPVCEKLGHDMRVTCQAPHQGPITIRSCARTGCRYTDDVRVLMKLASASSERY